MSLLGVLAVVIQILNGVLPLISEDAKFAGVAKSIQAAVEALQNAHDEVLTKAQLESLRTAPKW